MTTLSIDIETYSSINLQASGLYKYVQSPDFEILLFAYSYDGGPTQIVDLAQGEGIPYTVYRDLSDPQVVKTAFHAAFEINCLSKSFYTIPDQWRCTMVQALYCGYPGSLDAAGKALGLPRDKQKLSQGKALTGCIVKERGHPE